MVPNPGMPTDRPVTGIALCVFGLFLFSLVHTRSRVPLFTASQYHKKNLMTR